MCEAYFTMTSYPRAGMTEIHAETLCRMAAHEVAYRRKLDLYRQQAQKRIIRIKRSERELRRSVFEYNNKLKNHSDDNAEPSDNAFTMLPGRAKDVKCTRGHGDAHVSLPPVRCQAPDILEIMSQARARSKGNATVGSQCGSSSPNNVTSESLDKAGRANSVDRRKQQNCSDESKSNREQRMNELTLAMTKRLVPLDVACGKPRDGCDSSAEHSEHCGSDRPIRSRMNATQDDTFPPNENVISFLELIRLRQVCGLSKYPNLLGVITKKIEKETNKARITSKTKQPVVIAGRRRLSRPIMQSHRGPNTEGHMCPMQNNAAMMRNVVQETERGAPLRTRKTYVKHAETYPGIRDGEVTTSCIEKANAAPLRERLKLSPQRTTSGFVKLPRINEENKRRLCGPPGDSRASRTVATKQDERVNGKRQRRYGRQEEFEQVLPHLSLPDSYATFDCPPEKQCLVTSRNQLPRISREDIPTTRVVDSSANSTSSHKVKEQEEDATTILMEQKLNQERLQRLEQGNVLTWKESLASVRECHYLNST